MLEHGIEFLCIRLGYETECQWCTLAYSQANLNLMRPLQGWGERCHHHSCFVSSFRWTVYGRPIFRDTFDSLTWTDHGNQAFTATWHIQMRILKAEVKKSHMWPAVGDSSTYSTERFEGLNRESFHVNRRSKYSIENFEGRSGEGFHVILAHERL